MAFPCWYIAAWSCALLAGAVVAWRRRRELELLRTDYWRYLASPWKLVTFGLAAFPLIAFAPLSGDPTWDFVDAGFMAVLTFATGPWCVATLYRALRRRASLGALYVALCLWMLTAAWSYDLYIYLRDGVYPTTWAINIPASSVLYLSGGLVWSLGHTPHRGIHFDFVSADWPAPNGAMNYRRLAPWIAVFGVLYALVFIAALWSFG